MTRNDFILKKFPLICLVLSLVIFILSLANIGGTGNLERTVSKTENKLQARIEALDELIHNTLSIDPEAKTEPEKIDEDLVIYRYVNDSLVFWNNQFPILNDDISRKMVFHRLSPIDNRIESPLADVTQDFRYMQIGTKSYIIKFQDGVWNDRAIAGIEITNSLGEINPAFDLKVPYSVQPLSYNGGMAVNIDDTPLFKISHDPTHHSPVLDGCTLRWISILIFVLALVIFLAGHRTFKVYFAVVVILSALATAAYFWSIQLSDSHEIFSNKIFSDGIFSSLGSLLLTNAYIFIIGICTFLIKGRISGYINKDRKTAKRKAVIYGSLILICLIAIIVYIHIFGRSTVAYRSIYN